MIDLFNNPSNDYINPGLSPCPGNADEQYLTWDQKGLAVIKGSNIISLLDFTGMHIPVTAFNKQQVIVGPGEVIFIPGLTKGLCHRVQGFLMPSLTSTNAALNPYFMQLDFSINYYKNFSFTTTSFDVSGNYTQNVNIENAADIAMDKYGIRVGSLYEPSIFSFIGTVPGYDFQVSNVAISIIDASQNAASPFPKGANAPKYELPEDPSVSVLYAKYPNTAMQGIAVRGYYIDDFTECDKWFYLNHASDYAVEYNPVLLDFDADVSTRLSIEYDPSTSIGSRPSITVNVGDVSVGQRSTLVDIYDLTIDGSILDQYGVYSCIVSDSSISGSNLFDCSMYSTVMDDVYMVGMISSNCDITNSDVLNTIIVGTSMSNVQCAQCEIVSSPTMWSLINGGVVYTSVVSDSSIKDASVFASTLSSTSTQNVSVSGSIMNGTTSYDTIFSDSSLSSSQVIGSIINNNSNVVNSTIVGSWTNTYRLLVYNDPSFGPVYEYVDDPSMGVVTISGSTIWDSSINNTSITDSSLYNCTIRNSIVNGCTLYNCTLDNVEDVSSRTVMVDPSIGCVFEIVQDTSLYFVQKRKRIDTGMSGHSTDETMSAGDYLALVTATGQWKKVGEVYIWITAEDCENDCQNKNLVDGFYVFNPHDFTMKVEYITFV